MTATMAAPEHSFGKVKLGMDEEYEGELVGGVPWGQGRAAFADGSAFVGGWRDGAFDGVGRLHTSAPALQKPASRSGGSLYRGEFRRGAEDGLGVLQEQGVTFKGQFKAGLKGGWGLESRMDGRDVYMGQFHGGRRHGLALMRRGRGVLLVERWEHGAKVKEGAEVASEFVGGMAEAAAAVAEAAFVALASLADRKAAEAPEVLPAFFSRKKSLPRPTVAQVAGEAAGRRLSRAEAEVQALRKKLGKALDEMEELAGAARKAEKACESRGREIEELKQRHEKCKGDLASCKVQLRDADFKVEAIMESQQELVTELLHKQTSLHQQRLDVTLAQHRHLVLSLQMQLDQAKTALEAHESGSHAPARSGAGAGADGGGSKKKILMEPLVAEGMSREAARLALSEDALTLSGPRGYAAVGKPIATSKVAYSFRVERLEKEVEGYVGVICEASPSLSSCFALLYDDGTLGSGRLRACDEMEGSRRVENGAVVVLQIDADQDCIRLFQDGKQTASLAVNFPKPWQPVLLLMHERSKVTLEGEAKGMDKISLNSAIEERVATEWCARSVKTGSLFGVVQVLRLLQSAVLSAFDLSDLEDMLESHRSGHEKVMQTIQGRLNGTVPQIEI